MNMMMGPIVWTTIVLVGMISQTISGDGQAQSTAAGITVDQLVEHLANLPTKFPDASDSISEEIGGLLANTVDTTKIIFQGFNAEKLLELKEWNMDDCTEYKLRKRKAICQQFAPKTHLISSLKSLIEKCAKPKDEEQRVGASLGLYCLNHFGRIMTQCREHLYEKATNQLDGDTELKESLEQYHDRIIEYWRLNYQSNFFLVSRDLYKSKTTEIVYKGLSKEEKSQIGRFCSVVVEKLSLPLSDEKFVRSGGEKRALWRNYYKYCQITLEKFGKHIRNVAAHSELII